jgi:hypothetical protein
MSGFPVEGIDLAPGRVPDQDLSPPFAAFLGRGVDRRQRLDIVRDRITIIDWQYFRFAGRRRKRASGSHRERPADLSRR